MPSRYPITRAGHEKVRSELFRLKTKDRPKIIKSIADAREHGDLSENAEYHAAREKQGFIEAKIAQLELIISLSDVIDISSIVGDEVKFGATVEILDEESEEVKKYTIVSDYEANISAGLISIHSPLVKKIIGKKPQYSFEFVTGKGKKFLQIQSVEYIEHL